MKTDKEKESNWEDYFKQKQRELGMSDFEKFTLNRINKIIQKVKNPQERIDKLKKIRKAIEAYTYSSWSREALKRAESGIRDAKDEQVDRETENTDLSEEKYPTRLERVKRVEEIYREIGDYGLALDKFNKEMGKEIYKDYASFNSQRYKVRSK